MGYAHTIDGVTWRFADLKTLLARASPLRSGDVLAGVAAQIGRGAHGRAHGAGRPAARRVPLRSDLPYEEDDVTRLILDAHDKAAFAAVSGLTVGEFREWLLPRRPKTGHGARARAHPGDGRRRLQAHAQPGPGLGRAQVPRGDALPQHHRPAGPALGAAAAQPSHRRRARHRRLDARRPALRLRRRGDRRQPGGRRPRRLPAAVAHDGRADPALRRSRRSPACSPTSPARSRRSRRARRWTSSSSRSAARRRRTSASASALDLLARGE